MTKEAKVGLLLGLVFIVGIAVVLRGVSDGLDSEQEEQMLLGRADTSEYADSVAGRENLSMAAEQAEQLTPNPALEPVATPAPPPANEQIVAVASPTQPDQINNIRYVQTLPGSVSQPVSPSQSLTDIPAPTQPAGEPMFRPVSPSSMIAAGGEITGGGSLPGVVNIIAEPAKVVAAAPRPAARTYTVQSGDDLTKVARKVYGPVEGNRWVNIKRISDASGLTNMDTLRVGQKLTIPDVEGVQVRAVDQTVNARRGEKAVPASPPPASKSRTYVVKDGDTLWKIAQRELGDGARFGEITKINKLRDENAIKPGMKLRLP